MPSVRLRQIKSASGHKQDQQATLDALGIRRLHQIVEHEDTPQIRGMIAKVAHLVEVSSEGSNG
jgi:large subunit ribosomal protein L30